jgi:hypothetical protein
MVSCKIIGFGIKNLIPIFHKKMSSVTHHVSKGINSPSKFTSYIIENPFVTNSIKVKAKTMYNRKLIDNINRYIETNHKI